MTALAAFVAMTFGDFAWTRYIQSVAEKQRVAACWWAAVLAGIGGITTLAIQESAVNILFTVTGAAVGTWLASWWDD